MSLLEFASQTYDSSVLDMNACLLAQADVLRAEGDQHLADTILNFLSQSEHFAAEIRAH